ncbi:hypothetical protein F5883DRAFT_722196 [Diaporthe sp. PMI_573]|nr:hypothetical protein F5883DRAFT_722196 [Diaporthaceae sp. PMI_573]
MSDADLEVHKRSLSMILLEKLKNLDQDTYRIWDQITTEYYDFELSTKTAERVNELTKQGMVDFFKKHINPASPERTKISVWMIAQATSDESTKQISKLVKALELNSPEREAEAATDLQARLSAAEHDEGQGDGGPQGDKMDAAAEAWKKLHSKTNGVVGHQEEDPPSLNGTKICFIEDPRDFKARLPVSAGASPVKDLTEYEELDPKL